MSLTTEVTSRLRDALPRAADLLHHYAAFIHRDVKADDLERHPYLPEIEQAVADLRGSAALLGPVVPEGWSVDAIAKVLMSAWAKAEPAHPVTRYPASYVATFADMARAVLAAPPPPAASSNGGVIDRNDTAALVELLRRTLAFVHPYYFPGTASALRDEIIAALANRTPPQPASDEVTI